jgi:hypothetical protein
LKIQKGNQKPYVEGHAIQWPRYQRGNQKPYVEEHAIQWPRYQRGNQKPYVEGHAIQWPNEKGKTMIYKTLLNLDQHERHRVVSNKSVHLYE